jgi:hypothetical protein
MTVVAGECKVSWSWVQVSIDVAGEDQSGHGSW